MQSLLPDSSSHTGKHLLLNPDHRSCQPVAEFNAGLPAQILLNFRVVAITSIYALGSAQVVVALELHARKLLGHVHQLVDRHQFTGTKIDRLQNIAVVDIDDSLS